MSTLKELLTWYVKHMIFMEVNYLYNLSTLYLNTSSNTAIIWSPLTTRSWSIFSALFLSKCSSRKSRESIGNCISSVVILIFWKCILIQRNSSWGRVTIMRILIMLIHFRFLVSIRNIINFQWMIIWNRKNNMLKFGIKMNTKI